MHIRKFPCFGIRNTFLSTNCGSRLVYIFVGKNQSMGEILEYDSFINIHNNQLHGFPRGGMGILDSGIMEKATEVICKWIQF